MAGCKDIRAVGAAGKHEHVEVVLAQNEPALVLDVKAGIAKHATDKHQFLIVDFQYIATLERLLQYFLGIELLTQVDIENLQAVVRRGIEEFLDGRTADNVSLSQRTETNSTTVGGNLCDVVIEGDVVPSHVLLDVIGRDALFIKLHLHRTCWIRYAWQ